MFEMTRQSKEKQITAPKRRFTFGATSWWQNRGCSSKKRLWVKKKVVSLWRQL